MTKPRIYVNTSADDMANSLYCALKNNNLTLEDLETNLRLAEKRQEYTKTNILKIYIRKLRVYEALQAAENAHASQGGIVS